MIHELAPEDRLRLVRFVCSFAWADLEVADAEREFIQTLIARLELDEDERAQVAGWLTVPPSPEEVDPFEIPQEHRQIFLETVLGLVAADGELSEGERENFNLLSQLLR